MAATIVRRRKFITESGYTVHVPGTVAKSALDYRERVKQKILIEKTRRNEVRLRAKRVDASGKPLRAGKGVDFNKLDQRGEPSISFDPGSPLREGMLKLLAAKERDPTRKKLMLKIGGEFARIYTRYRRDAQRDLGAIGTYEVMEQERKYAAEAGMWCIVKAVTPRDVLEYWHTHIKTFAAKGMQVPPLSLLKSPGIIDQVACAAMDGQPIVSKTKTGKERWAESKNSFSDPSRLDRRLRASLQREGFDMSDYNDRFLLTVQKMAMAVASGKTPFVSAEIKPMVVWAAENVYVE